MDEVDGMVSGDRGGISEIISLLCPKRKKGRKKKNEVSSLPYKNPVICISNKDSEKKILDLKKISLPIYFEKPKYSELTNAIHNIALKENLIIDIEGINLIIKNSQSDYRRIMGILQEINRTYKGEIISISHIDNVLSIFNKKDLDISLYDGVREIFNNYKNIDHSLTLYQLDRNLLPMMIHENSINYLAFNIDDTYLEKTKSFHKIIDNLSNADIIDKNIYGEQNWELSELNGINKVCEPAYILSQHKNITKKNIDINYSSVLSKSSQQFSYYKELVKISDVFNCNIYNVIYIIEYILYSIFNKKGNTDIGIDILIKYNLDIDYIDNLIKVCKIDLSYRSEFTCRKKTILKKLYLERLNK